MDLERGFVGKIELHRLRRRRQRQIIGCHFAQDMSPVREVEAMPTKVFQPAIGRNRLDQPWCNSSRGVSGYKLIRDFRHLGSEGGNQSKPLNSVAGSKDPRKYSGFC
jgi:hypothetical protein